MAFANITESIQNRSTVSRTLALLEKNIEFGTFSVTDFYATIGDGFVTLLKRIKKTPILEGGIFKIAIDEYEYTAAYGYNYNPTNDESATTGRFTIELGEKKGETRYTANQVLLPDLYVLLEDPLTA